MIDQADFLKTTKKDTKLWARFTKRAAHILLISALAEQSNRGVFRVGFFSAAPALAIARETLRRVRKGSGV